MSSYKPSSYPSYEQKRKLWVATGLHVRVLVFNLCMYSINIKIETPVQKPDDEPTSRPRNFVISMKIHAVGIVRLRTKTTEIFFIN
jgi:hypothetical protein